MKISLVVKIAILSASMCTMASDMVIVPILDLLYRAFPDTSQTPVCFNRRNGIYDCWYCIYTGITSDTFFM